MKKTDLVSRLYRITKKQDKKVKKAAKVANNSSSSVIRSLIETIK